jgi:photosystem II stability/assembly factor-like uncharacterized protein
LWVEGVSWLSSTLPTAIAINGGVCVDSAHCAVAGYNSSNFGVVFMTQDGASTWQLSLLPMSSPYLQSAIDCVTASICFTVGSVGTSSSIAWTTDAGTTWQVYYQTDLTLSGVKCSSAAICRAVGQKVSSKMAVVITTINGGGWWTTTTLVPGSLNAIDCLNATSCYVVGATTAGYALVALTSDRDTWTSAQQTANSALHGVSCPLVSACNPGLYGRLHSGSLSCLVSTIHRCCV